MIVRTVEIFIRLLMVFLAMLAGNALAHNHAAVIPALVAVFLLLCLSFVDWRRVR